MKTLTSAVPKYLFSSIMIIFGLLHFVAASAMAGVVPIPGGMFWVYFTGLAFIAAGVSFIIKKYDYLAGLLLAAMLLIFILTIKVPMMMNAADQATMQHTLLDIMKDLCLISGALMFSNIASERAS
ncbi:MAG: DoxX family protein [Bacteroidia bacterium]|nr:DoxX family protein [Bacteroidia bacterium]